MTKQEITSLRAKISRYIDDRRLRDAIREIKLMAHQLGAFPIEDKIGQTEQNYRYMLLYLSQGAVDPQRKAVYDGIVQEIYTALDMLIVHIEREDNPSLYYSNLRYRHSSRDSESLEEMFERYGKLTDDLSLFSMVISSDRSEETKKHKELEKLQSDIFVYIWTTPQLTKDQGETINAALESASIPDSFKQQIVSALHLGLQKSFDKRKLELLMKTYLNSGDLKVSSAALVGMLLGLWKYSNRQLSVKLNDILQTVKDKETWSRDLRLAFIEIIRARDTERINRKMRDEVIPRMQQLRPDLMDKINKANLDVDDPMSLQENPEWQDLLEKSGVADQLKELTEIQMEGGDVMMSTFAHLKQFPFFNNIANWFLPFDPNHSAVKDVMSQLDVIGDMMENARFLCDSDKYSFMLAIDSVPTDQKKLMVSQMKAQSDTIYEAMNQMDNSDHADNRRMALNSYMQNIYRFYKLFYRKDEFFDPFDKGVNLISVPSLADDFDDVEMLQVVAEFYFKLKYMQEAISVYTRIEELEAGDASRYQKMGYCYEHLQEYDKAIDYYLRAELLDSNSQWTAKRLASCYRAMGKKSMALQYYKRLAEREPDNLNLAMLYGQSLLENGDYREALQEFYKVEFLDEKSTRALRPLAWTLFVTGDLEGALNYYKKILDDEPTHTDYLNYGHVTLAKGNIGDAINLYAKAIRANKGNTEWFVKALKADKADLLKAGVDTEALPLVADATLYKIIEN